MPPNESIYFKDSRIGRLTDFCSAVESLVDNWCDGHLLDGLDPDLVALLFPPVFSAAFALSIYGIDPNKPTVTFAGAEVVELVDGGYWMTELVPYLLGIERSEEISLDFQMMGMNLTPTSSSLLGDIDSFSVLASDASLDEFVEAGANCGSGLMIFFQPGLESNWKSWLGDDADSLHRILDAGTTIVMGGYDADETEFDRKMLILYGFQPTECIPNPFTAEVTGDDAPVANYFAHSMFALKPNAGHIKTRPQKTLIRRLLSSYHEKVLTPEVLMYLNRQHAGLL